MFAFLSLKRRIILIVVGSLIALLFVVHMMSFAFASTLIPGTTGVKTFQGPPPPIGHQQNNQSFHGITNSGNRAQTIGANQGNSGNQGINRGDNQDSSVNGANAVSSQHKPIGVQQNDQLIQGNGGGSNSGNSATFIGHNQGNSGNQGWNSGNNQDNSANAGNQVNNQASTIGTQINLQSNEVNNQGNTIEHQINYINLLPGLGVSLSLQPKLQLGLSVGKQNSSLQLPKILSAPNAGTQNALTKPAQKDAKVAAAGR